MRVIQPKRVRHSTRQSWKGHVSAVFPLLCPVKEMDWVPDWEPSLVISESGLMEMNCLFLEPEGSNEAIWIVTGYKKEQYVDMYRILPNVCVSRFSINLFNKGKDSTEAEILYEHTALSEAGGIFVSQFTDRKFSEFISHFSEAINYYLVTGKKIEA